MDPIRISQYGHPISNQNSHLGTHATGLGIQLQEEYDNKYMGRRSKDTHRMVV